MRDNKEFIVLGGGCFWCTEAVYKMLKGVISVVPGYAGGVRENPTYEEVSSGLTGHAEVIRVEYDLEFISTHDILTVFFASHDPTTLNRQGNDTGTQYRSIVLYTNNKQRQEVLKFIEKLNRELSGEHKLVTEVKPLEAFYYAEGYHTDYYKNHPEEAYCQVVINPKLEKVQKKFAELLKTNQHESEKNN